MIAANDRQDRVRPINEKAKERQEDRHGYAVSARHHQGEPSDPLLLLGGLFQETTTRVPPEAAVNGKFDPLEVFKETYCRPADPGGTWRIHAKIREVAGSAKDDPR